MEAKIEKFVYCLMYIDSQVFGVTDFKKYHLFIVSCFINKNIFIQLLTVFELVFKGVNSTCQAFKPFNHYYEGSEYSKLSMPLILY